MLEYETANPGQDRSKPEGEHFNPDADTSAAQVSFAPGDYVIDMTKSNTPSGIHGIPKEYSTARRPHSDSPAPPHPNDQFTGLAEGGVHANDSKERAGSNSSDHTLIQDGPASPMKSAMKPGALTQQTDAKEHSAKSNTRRN